MQELTIIFHRNATELTPSVQSLWKSLKIGKFWLENRQIMPYNKTKIAQEPTRMLKKLRRAENLGSY